MKKYDKTVVLRRFRQRRRERQGQAGSPGDKWISVFLGLFALGAVILFAVVVIAFLG